MDPFTYQDFNNIVKLVEYIHINYKHETLPITKQQTLKGLQLILHRIQYLNLFIRELIQTRTESINKKIYSSWTKEDIINFIKYNKYNKIKDNEIYKFQNLANKELENICYNLFRFSKEVKLFRDIIYFQPDSLTLKDMSVDIVFNSDIHLIYLIQTHEYSLLSKIISSNCIKKMINRFIYNGFTMEDITNIIDLDVDTLYGFINISFYDDEVI